MAYCSTSDVAAYCSNLITGASDFSASTVPTQAQVTRWLSSGSALIDSALMQRGFAPVSDSSCTLYQEFSEMNALYGAAKAETARTNVRLAPGERTRGQVFAKEFADWLKELQSRDLSRAGLSYSHLGYVGGVSIADKDTVSSDTDRVSPRFNRDEFKNPRAPSHKENSQNDDIEVRQ